MRIAQIAPLFESVPPKLYGGTERVVSFLTEELVRLGHQVTLFASGDSRTTATLVPVCTTAGGLVRRPGGAAYYDARTRSAASARVRRHPFSHIATSLSGNASA